MTIKELMNTREYQECGFQIVKCPVCGNHTLDNFFICPDCGWEYDGITDLDQYSFCNQCTPKEYREEIADAQQKD